MIQKIVEDAEELGLEWVNRRTEDVVQDIALMRLGIAQGYIDAPADYSFGEPEDWEEPNRDCRGDSDVDESLFYEELEKGYSQDRI